jgi:methionyl-tRNA synthetase
MKEVTFGNDGNFSKENLITRNNSELANKIGNLLQRTSSFVFKHCNASIPPVLPSYIDEAYNTPLLLDILSIQQQNITAMKEFQINKVLDNIIHITDQANIYIDKEAPWSLKNTDTIKMNQVLYNLLESLRFIGIMLQPFVPDSASKILDQLNVAKDQRSFSHLNKKYALKPSSAIMQPIPIFPRFEK